MLDSLVLHLSPKELSRMARREYQDPPLKKTKGQNPRWYIRVRKRVIDPDGNVRRAQTREYLGFCHTLPTREAQRARGERLKLINGQIFEVGSQTFLKDFVLIWNARHLPTVGSCAQKKYRSLLQHIVAEFGEKQLSDMKTADIQGFLNAKKESGLSWWTCNDLRNILSSIFTKARDWEYWPESKPNPVERTTCGRKKAAREKRLLADEQIKALFGELPGFMRLIIRIADTTGLRISEILGLKWQDIDFTTGWITIRGRYTRGDYGEPKTDGSNRSVPIGELAEDLWLMHLHLYRVSDSSFVFCKEHESDQPYDDRELNKLYLRPAAKKLGFYWKGFGFHAFRRNQITGVQSVAGASAIEAAKMAGHSRVHTTFDYTLNQRARQEEIIAAWQKRLA